MFNASDYGSDVLTKAKFRYLLTKGNTVAFVHRDGAEIAGYILLLFRRGVKTARIYSVAVSPAHQAKGIGAALFEAAEQYCRKQGYSKLMLETRVDNEGLQKLCLRRGYNPLKLVPDYYPKGIAAQKFALTLNEKGA